MAKTAAQVQAWVLALEAERHDTSWRKPRPVVERYAPEAAKPPVIPRKAKPESTVSQKQRDQIMFHAGRYAAGARDEQATQANAAVGKLIHGGK